MNAAFSVYCQCIFFQRQLSFAAKDCKKRKKDELKKGRGDLKSDMTNVY